jgi:hypothetical protein
VWNYFGTTGDIESLPFLEAIRQIRSDLGRENVMYVHCTLLPYIKAAGRNSLTLCCVGLVFISPAALIYGNSVQ